MIPAAIIDLKTTSKLSFASTFTYVQWISQIWCAKSYNFLWECYMMFKTCLKSSASDMALFPDSQLTLWTGAAAVTHQSKPVMMWGG